MSSRYKKTVLAALLIAKSVISKELHNPSGLTQEVIEGFDVDQKMVNKELQTIIDYLTTREIRNEVTTDSQRPGSG